MCSLTNNIDIHLIFYALLQTIVWLIPNYLIVKIYLRFTYLKWLIIILTNKIPAYKAKFYNLNYHISLCSTSCTILYLLKAPLLYPIAFLDDIARKYPIEGCYPTWDNWLIKSIYFHQKDLEINSTAKPWSTLCLLEKISYFLLYPILNPVKIYFSLKPYHSISSYISHINIYILRHLLSLVSKDPNLKWLYSKIRKFYIHLYILISNNKLLNILQNNPLLFIILNKINKSKLLICILITIIDPISYAVSKLILPKFLTILLMCRPFTLINILFNPKILLSILLSLIKSHLKHVYTHIIYNILTKSSSPIIKKFILIIKIPTKPLVTVAVIIYNILNPFIKPLVNIYTFIKPLLKTYIKIPIFYMFSMLYKNKSSSCPPHYKKIKILKSLNIFMSNQIFYTAKYILYIITIFLIIPTTIIMWKSSVLIIEWYLLSLPLTPISITLILDRKGILFSCIVLFISANIISFSTIYIRNDKFVNRFTILVILFVASINLLIYIPHFIILLLGWDGLGIVSFILVIYYQNPKSLAAGIITAITNRIGDVFLLLAIGLTLNMGHWNISYIWSSYEIFPLQVIFIILAAITKSAQIPFSRWLPAAIAAPTPVSALVHSSTLVTAGVFLIIRFYNFLSSLPIYNTLILLVATSTLIIAGISATTECDIKKIIALSTLSQLGIITASLGLNLPSCAFFHISIHALFKALLFVCAGVYIRMHSHRQDLRWIGNLTTQIPVASSCTIIANLSLCGLPFITGFYSKDLILEYSMFNICNTVRVRLLFFAVGLTSIYRLRFTLRTSWSPANSSPFILYYEPKSVISPIINLSIMSIIAGSLILWILPTQETLIIIPLAQKLCPTIIIILGALTRILISLNYSSYNSPLIHYISSLIWFITPLSSQPLIKVSINRRKQATEHIDASWLELASAQGIRNLVNYTRNIITIKLIRSPSGHILLASISIALTSTIIFT